MMYVMHVGFNRYMVECEFKLPPIRLVTHCAVLIDTWWNVNMWDLQEKDYSADGFNRYMVECECLYFKPITMHIVVLIDTWWNVNGKRGISFF